MGTSCAGVASGCSDSLFHYSSHHPEQTLDGCAFNLNIVQQEKRGRERAGKKAKVIKYYLFGIDFWLTSEILMVLDNLKVHHQCFFDTSG